MFNFAQKSSDARDSFFFRRASAANNFMNKDLETQQILAGLVENLSDVSGAVIATLDGIVIASAYTDGKSNQLAAMTAAALGLGRRMIEMIGAGNLAAISIAGDNGSVFVYAVGARAVLLVITKKMPNVAMVNWEARKIIEQLTGRSASH